jgi:hypothetical protein
MTLVVISFLEVAEEKRLALVADSLGLRTPAARKGTRACLSIVPCCNCRYLERRASRV